MSLWSLIPRRRAYRCLGSGRLRDWFWGLEVGLCLWIRQAWVHCNIWCSSCDEIIALIVSASGVGACRRVQLCIHREAEVLTSGSGRLTAVCTHSDGDGESTELGDTLPRVRLCWWSAVPFRWFHLTFPSRNSSSGGWRYFFLSSYETWLSLFFIYFLKCTWASLVAQWLRICLPMQGTWVQALVWEDPTCRGATRTVSHNYWACASGACAPQQERPR